MCRDVTLHSSALPSALASMREDTPAVRACGLLCSLLTECDIRPPPLRLRARGSKPAFRQTMIAGFTCQMSSAYSLIVRSEENTPELAMLIADDLSHAA